MGFSRLSAHKYKAIAAIARIADTGLLPNHAAALAGGALIVGAAGMVLVSMAQPAHAQTYTLSTVAAFNGTNGSGALGGVTFDSLGNLYGTTYGGGANNEGTVYKIAAGTSTINTIDSFNGAGTGAYSRAGVTFDGSGNLYGTTTGGGSNNMGTVYKIAAGTSTITTLATFNGTGNGAYSYAGLTLDNSGNLYGTTYGGGASSIGSVFKIAAGTNTVTTLASFNANGAYPLAGLTVDGSGNIYGTTGGGGTYGYGTVFKIAAGTSTITTLATFNGAGNGQGPLGVITLDSLGNIYGTTADQSGVANNGGTVFKIAAGSSTITTLVTFNTTNGKTPRSGLTLDSLGNLYGTTSEGGANNLGTVYELAAGTGGVVGGGAFSTLATFNGTNGSDSEAGLTLDGNGNLYGTTGGGGANSAGTVFKLTPSASAATPEPSALLLLAPGALGMVGMIARRRKVV